MKTSIVSRRVLAAAHVLTLSVAHAGQNPGLGDPIPEVKATAVPEPSPLFLLAGAMAMLLLLMRKGGPRSR